LGSNAGFCGATKLLTQANHRPCVFFVGLGDFQIVNWRLLLQGPTDKPVIMVHFVPVPTEKLREILAHTIEQIENRNASLFCTVRVSLCIFDAQYCV